MFGGSGAMGWGDCIDWDDCCDPCDDWLDEECEDCFAEEPDPCPCDGAFGEGPGGDMSWVDACGD